MRIGLVITGLALVAVPSAAQERPNLLIGGEENQRLELANPIGVLAIGTRVVILESAPPFLHVVSTSGELTQSVGRKGQGPGEFERPIALLHDSASKQILVVDRASRVTYYSIGDSLVLTLTRRLPMVPYGACLVGGHLWIARPDESGLLHEVSASGDALNVSRSLGTFQTTHAAGNTLVGRALVMPGPLVCDQVRNVAYLVSKLTGEVRVLPLSGGPTELYKLPGFVSAEVKVADGGKPVGVTAPPGGKFDESIGTLLTATGAAVIVGHKTEAQPSAGDYHSFRLFSLGTSGATLEAVSNRWRWFGQTSLGVFCYATEPAPTIARFLSGRCPAS